MRYARQEDLLRLAMLLQSSTEGMSLADIQAEFEVSRRTAERMRDAVMRALPAIVEFKDETGQKFWRLPSGTIGRIIEPDIQEISALRRAAAIAKREGDSQTAAQVERVAIKLQANLSDNRKLKVAPDLEAELMADGVAFRPGPRENIPNEILSGLREAILAGRTIVLDYHARGSGKLTKDLQIGPLAILFGQGRQYLLGSNSLHAKPRLYALAGIQSLRQTSQVYERPKHFNLQDWLDESFGVWREEPWDVEWRFLPHVAQEAAGYLFHPKQSGKWLEDGSYLVQFRAGGRQEMEWYLTRWGDGVEPKYQAAPKHTSVSDV